MSDASLRLLVRLVRAWTRLYTAGLPPDLRDRRRAEIESDLWESQQSPGAAPHMLLRLLLGLRDDLAWRTSYRTGSIFMRAALAALIAAGVLASGILLTAGRAAVLPAPPPLTRHARVLPPPPPPPPPPCAPPGSGRQSPSPCTR